MICNVVLHVGLIILINNMEPNYISAYEVKRDKMGDVFPVNSCGIPEYCMVRSTRCTANSYKCRHANAVCEDPLCCYCRCRASNNTATYVKILSRCSGNEHLPENLNMDRRDYKYRLVAKYDSGSSCSKKTVPVINMNIPGNCPIEMCFNQTTARLERNESCSVEMKRLKYFVDGVWYKYPARSAGATFQIDNTRTGLMLKALQWDRSFGQQSLNKLFSVIASCHPAGRHRRRAIACLLVKSSNTTSNRNNVTSTYNITVRTETEQYVDVSTTQAVVLRRTSVPTTTRQPVAKPNDRARIYIIVAAGCAVFIFCVSIICILLCLVRRKRRQEMSRKSKRNPLYDESMSTRFVASPKERMHQNGSSQETSTQYQPLIQNTRVKNGKQPVVYQPLTKKKINMETINEHKEPPSSSDGASCRGRNNRGAKPTPFGSQKRLYQALTLPKETNHGDQNKDNVKPVPGHYSSPEVFQTVIMPVNVKRLQGYYEPECIVLHRRGQADETTTLNACSNERNHYQEPSNLVQPEYDVLQPNVNSPGMQLSEKRAVIEHQLSNIQCKLNKANAPSPEYEYLEPGPLYQELDN